MKKLFSVLVIALAVLMLFVACNNDPKEQNNPVTLKM